MRSIVIIIIVIICSCNTTKQDWIDRTKHEGLHNIEYSEFFETYATAENPENIKNTIHILEQGKTYFDKVFDEDLTFAVMFVDNKNWNTYAFSPPPGMPQAHYEGNIVLGLGKSVMATMAEQGLQRAPGAMDALRPYFGEAVDLDLFYRDGLSLHELGHLYQFYKTGKSSQRRWLNETFGNLCQVAAAKNLSSPDVFNQMDTYQTLLINANRWGDLKYKTLQQFEESYFDVMQAGQNYGWYQTQFYLNAKELYAKYGDTFLNTFRDFLIDTNPDTIGKLNDAALRDAMVKKLGPEATSMLNWKYDSE